MTSPDEASRPGPPPLLWAPSLASRTEIPWRPGFAVWHRSWEVWVPLVCEHLAPYGNHPPHDAILLAPETPSDGAPDLAARVDHLERLLRRALGQQDGSGAA